MPFGNRKKKVKNSVSEDSGTVDKVSEKVSDKSDNSDSNNSGISDSGTHDNDVKASSFLKRKGKSKKSNVLLFGMAKEEKLELFIRNIKIIHPGMPKFWLQLEIDKFKKKFNM